MGTNQILDEIREVNLSYLLLAQQMLREDRIAAMYRLGIDEDIADILVKLTNSQLLKMAGSNMLLCRFRFDDSLIAEILTSHKQDRALTQSHAAILMAGLPAEKIS
ncbi:MULTISPECIES: flagellar transcriptional regulator FlhD [Nitrosomonas]|jgi:flagellar transcriptional activator FlhD|uniref:Flagellar transcriptional regulator FlhD n=1 Tax=Nitrosomonas europaea (strain ATCC 19718 / CIP 103999 / KCTC 2705 / NBRC 14298) TaxID=228410 RepID=FLHD_NITEU|nr:MULTISPECIES: flagellar transcriptional regulator FlhD [Nitrosomonas]Q82SD3.1 RecName: Full=Flagellar transcriptional regulator FlhD [Nitrosomonas europaea ATCC 19718]KXK48226.1 MAG: transcriptional activator FlhD [Nitrosomonas europaea]MBV6390790.1 Flagellar transcriptional regulator FlhD [Nitrosomonas europaea]MEB2331955.1 flagellar transcriptional regulator FlhD [Nitrosomonas sp.]QOJ10153.1 MAG: flagellar transcriptional regulator FlhD [Nitrosomonas sp. H1_AOB3]CAD86319.1 probable flage